MAPGALLDGQQELRVSLRVGLHGWIAEQPDTSAHGGQRCPQLVRDRREQVRSQAFQLLEPHHCLGPPLQHRAGVLLSEHRQDVARLSAFRVRDADESKTRQARQDTGRAVRLTGGIQRREVLRQLGCRHTLADQQEGSRGQDLLLSLEFRRRWQHRTSHFSSPHSPGDPCK
jgi:hypothetical protein